MSHNWYCYVTVCS